MWTDGDSGSPVPIEELLDKQKRRTGRSTASAVATAAALDRKPEDRAGDPQWAQRLNEESRAGRGTGTFRVITACYGPRAYRSVTLRPSPEAPRSSGVRPRSGSGSGLQRHRPRRARRL